MPPGDLDQSPPRRPRSALPAGAARSYLDHTPPERPETTDRGLGCAGRLARDAGTTHLQDRGNILLRARDAAFDEAADAAILHRHEAGGPAKIQVTQPALAHLGRILGVAEVDPFQVST